MKTIRLFMALLLGKAAIFLSRRMGNQGTDFPGRLARKIYPGILRDLARDVRHETVIITGTNGKTTSANLLAAIVREHSSMVIHNQAGANMTSGITTAFIEKAGLLRRKTFGYALLETDEAHVPLLLEEIHIDIILITNFFRDQLDRYGELDHMIHLIREAVRGRSLKLILNADDPLVTPFRELDDGVQTWYYGFTKTIYDSGESDETREGRFCLICGHELHYDTYHYAQLGKYACLHCGNTNPPAQFTASGLVMHNGIRMMVNELEITSPYQEFYNAYNILAAVSAARLMGIGEEKIQAAIAAFKPTAGRMEEFNISGKKVVLSLIKNPTGLNQTLTAILRDRGDKQLFIALNDHVADGRDISWIWDANVEQLAAPDLCLHRIVASGRRSGDMALRLKYAGADPEKLIIEAELEQGIRLILQEGPGAAYMLCTYTALFPCRKILRSMQ